MGKEPKRLEWTKEELDEFFARLERDELTDSDRKNIREMIAAIIWMAERLEDKDLSIKRLQRLFGIKTEKAANIFGKGDDGNKPDKDDDLPPPGVKNKNPDQVPKGKNGADDYPNAERIYYPHESLHVGGTCPSCTMGTLYHYGTGSVLRLRGQSPIVATVHQPEQLRCSACQEVFTAKLPESIGTERADPSAKTVVAMFRYGVGLPFYRQETMSGFFQTPLPDSTQWDMAEDVLDAAYPAFNALVGHAAAHGSLFNADDTGMRVLNLKKQLKAENAERTGIFTTGVLAKADGKEIALFFTGNKHAGENMADLLKNRPVNSSQGPPKLMCDALSRNVPKNVDVIVGNCMDHARRGYVDIAHKHREECLHFINRAGDIYRADREAKRLRLDDDARLELHRKKSLPIMEELRSWCEGKITNKEVEPNSPLGGTLQYFLNHYTALVQFCMVPGMPLSNAAVERLIKTSVLHRKNSLFYLTVMGALVGDVLMSLIQTAKRAGANVLDYLTRLQEFAGDVKKNPAAWLPWNYLERIVILQTAR
jgi:hypothetical protein